MNAELAIALLPIALSGIVSVGVAVLCFRRQTTAGAREYAVVALGRALPTFASIGVLASLTLENKMVWDMVTWSLRSISPIALLGFALSYTGRTLRRPVLVYSLIAFCPVVATIIGLILLPNGLLHANPKLIPGLVFTDLGYSLGPLGWLVLIYDNLLVFVGIAFLVIYFLKSQPLFRAQIATVVAGNVITLIGGAAMAAGTKLLNQHDTYPFTVAIANLIVAWGLLYFRLFDLVPIAHEKLIEQMTDIVVVMDGDNRVVDLNRAALKTVGKPKREVIGKSSSQVWPNQTGFIERFQDIERANTEIAVLGPDAATYYFDLDITPFYGKPGKCIGHLIVARDITRLKSIENELRQQRSELKKTVSQRTAALTRANKQLKQDIRERERMTSELRERDERLRMLTEATFEGVGITENGIFVEANQQLADMVGATVDELIGTPIISFVAPESRDEVLRRIQDGDETPFAHKALKRDGTIFPVEIRSRMINRNGQWVGLTAIRDITDRTRAEEVIKEAESRYRAIVEDQTEFVVRWKPDGTRTFANQVYCRYFGQAYDQIVGTSFFPLIVAEDQPAVRDRLNALTQKNPVSTGVHQIIRPDGSISWQEWTDRAIFDDQGQLIEMQSVGRDISERKNAEEALRESEERFRTLVENSPAGIYMGDDSFRFTYANQQLAELIGYSIDEIVGRDFRGFIAPDDVNRLLDIYLRRRRGEDVPNQFEFDAIRKNGERRHVQANVGTVQLPDGTVRSLGQILDITERKRADEQLRRSEAALSQAQRVSHVGSWAWHIKADLLEWSDEMHHIFGLEKEGFSGSLSEVVNKAIHPEDRSRVNESNRQVVEGEKPTPLECRVIWPDGSVHIVWAEAGELITDDQGTPTVLTGIVQDITERKHMEEALRASEAKYRAIFDNAPLGIFQTTPDGRYLTANPALARLYGYDSPEALMAGITNISRQVYANPARRKDFKRLLKKQGEIHDFESENVRQDGSRIWVSTDARVVRDAQGRILYYEGFVSDITERRQAEEALRQQNKYLLALQETALELVSQLDLKILLENIVRRAGQLIGAASGIVEMVDPATGQLQPRIYLGPMLPAAKYRADPGEGLTGIVWQTGQPLVVNDYDAWQGRVGNYPRGVLSSLIGVPLLSGEQVLGVLTVGHEFATRRTFEQEDIEILIQFSRLAVIAIQNARLFATGQQELAERKRVEEKLQETTNFLQQVVDTSPSMIFVLDGQGQLVFVNQYAVQYYGSTPEELTSKSTKDVHRPESEVQGFVSDDQEVIRTRTKIVKDEMNTAPNGEKHWFHTVKVPLLRPDGAVEVLGISTDITERKRVEEALHRSEQRFHAIYDQSPLGITVVDSGSGRYLEVNPKFCDIVGRSREEILQTDLQSITHPDDLPTDLDLMVKLRAREISHFAMQKRYVRPDGSVVWVNMSVVPLWVEGDTELRHVAISEDITDRKRAEDALQASEQRFRSVVTTLGDGILVQDAEEHFIDCNPAAVEMIGLSRERILGMTGTDSIWKLTRQDGSIFPLDERPGAICLRTGQPQRNIITGYTRPDGNQRWVSLSCEPIAVGAVETGRGVSRGVLMSITDLTEHMASEQKLLRYADQLTLLSKVGRQISGMLDAKKVLEQTVQTIHELFNYDHIGVFLFDDRTTRLTIRTLGGRNADEFPEGHYLELGQGIVGTAARNRQTMLSNDVSETPEYIKPFKDLTIGSEISVPIMLGSTLIGVLDTQDRSLNAFSDTDVMVLETLAAQLAVGLQNARLFDAERRERTLAQIYQRAIEVMIEFDNIENALDQVAGLLGELAAFDRLNIMLVEDDELKVVAHREAPNAEKSPGDTYQYPTVPLLYKSMSDVEVLVLPNGGLRNPDFLKLPGYTAATTGWVGIPLVTASVVIGYMSVATDRLDGYSRTDVQVLSTFARQVVLALGHTRLLAQLEQSNARLTRLARLSAAGEIATGVAHQINNPLTAVVTQAHLLVQSSPHDSEAYQRGSKIERAALRAANVVQRMLDLARAHPQSLTTLDLNKSVADAILLVRAQIEPHIAHILVNPCPQELPIEGSEEHLADVWLNLLLNARDALEGIPDARITVSVFLAADANKACVRIEDNGPGVPRDLQAHIFDPFNTSKPHGTGLGLSICHEIVSRHGGTIDLETAATGGASFLISLPIVRAATGNGDA